MNDRAKVKPQPAAASGRVRSSIINHQSSFRPAFTLIELMLVAAIIVLAVAVAVPSLQGIGQSNRFAQVVNTLGGLVTTAQAAASNGNWAGIRIERAFEVDNQTGLMIKNGRTPVWRLHQQARIVSQGGAGREGSPYTLKHALEGRAYPLPVDVWLAPGYCLGLEPDRLDWTAPALAENSDKFTYEPDDPKAAVYSPFDTFYVLFDSNGELRSCPKELYVYEDRLQQWYDTAKKEYKNPIVYHPDDSARSVLIYDRRKWAGINPYDDAGRRQFLAREARVIHFNRITGAVVGGSP